MASSDLAKRGQHSDLTRKSGDNGQGHSGVGSRNLDPAPNNGMGNPWTQDGNSKRDLRNVMRNERGK